MSRFTSIAYLAGLLFFIPLSIFAQWENLFNGKDLTGWKQLNGKAKYEVKDGMIIGTTVAGEPNSFLATAINYGDFIFETDFIVDGRMNSGIQFRSEQKDAADTCHLMHHRSYTRDHK